MVVPEAQIRANHSKHVISRIKVLAEPDRTRLLARVAAPREMLREASVFDWLPAHIHVQLVDGVCEMLPPVRAVAFWRGLMADAFSKSLLRPIVQGAIAIHGRSPKSLIRMGPRTWHLISKNAGQLVVDLERGACDASGTLSELPAVINKSSGMLQFFEGGLSACVEHFGLTPHVRTDASRIARGDVRIDISWDGA